MPDEKPTVIKTGTMGSDSAELAKKFERAKKNGAIETTKRVVTK